MTLRATGTTVAVKKPYDMDLRIGSVVSNVLTAYLRIEGTALHAMDKELVKTLRMIQRAHSCNMNKTITPNAPTISLFVVKASVAVEDGRMALVPNMKANIAAI
mmetsp:Transcript_8817/g.10612  ORF Transcript_8817/g.10612 Transcript_8817/m.10612 type:complete len:104 (-) Transcript_8817:410-721(-)